MCQVPHPQEKALVSQITSMTPILNKTLRCQIAARSGHISSFLTCCKSNARSRLSYWCRSTEVNSDDDLFSSPPKIPKTKSSTARTAKQKAPFAKSRKKAVEPDSLVLSEDSVAEDKGISSPHLEEDETSAPQAASNEESGSHILQARIAEENAGPTPQAASIVAQELDETVGDSLELTSGNALCSKNLRFSL